jgi:hypothetical protein
MGQAQACTGEVAAQPNHNEAYRRILGRAFTPGEKHLASPAEKVVTDDSCLKPRTAAIDAVTPRSVRDSDRGMRLIPWQTYPRLHVLRNCQGMKEAVSIRVHTYGQGYLPTRFLRVSYTSQPTLRSTFLRQYMCTHIGETILNSAFARCRPLARSKRSL